MKTPLMDLFSKLYRRFNIWKNLGNYHKKKKKWRNFQEKFPIFFRKIQDFGIEKVSCFCDLLSNYFLILIYHNWVFIYCKIFRVVCSLVIFYWKKDQKDSREKRSKEDPGWEQDFKMIQLEFFQTWEFVLWQNSQ